MNKIENISWEDWAWRPVVEDEGIMPLRLELCASDDSFGEALDAWSHRDERKTA